jgi:PAS domain S-box-containing protein
MSRKRRTPVDDPLIQHALLGEAVDTGPAAVFVLGADRKYVAVNDTACRLLGYGRGELLALDPSEIAPALDVDALLEELERGGSMRGTLELRTKGGELVTCSYRSSAATAAHMRFWISVVFPD